MVPAKYNIKIYQGSTYSQLFTIKDSGIPRDLSGYTIKMSLKRTKTSSEAELTLSTENGRIIILEPSSSGQFQLLLSASETKLLDRNLIYDIDFQKGSTVETYLRGSVIVGKEVTA